MTNNTVLIFCIILLCLAPAPSRAGNICGTAQTTPQATQCPGPINSIATYQAAKADKGKATYPIDLWGKCRYIDSTSTEAFFVPFQTSAEWLAIITNAPVGITASPCARASAMTISPSGSCSAAAQTVLLDYARVGVTASRSVTFTCPVPGNCNPRGSCGATQYWYQTATATYLSLNSDSNAPSWQQTGITYANTTIPSPAAAPPYCYTTSYSYTMYYTGFLWCSHLRGTCGWMTKDYPTTSAACWGDHFVYSSYYWNGWYPIGFSARVGSDPTDYTIAYCKESSPSRSYSGTTTVCQ